MGSKVVLVGIEHSWVVNVAESMLTSWIVVDKEK